MNNNCTFNIHKTTKHNIIMLEEQLAESSGVAEWLTSQTSNVRIADHVGSNPVRAKPLFP
jgi:hypothetical protein